MLRRSAATAALAFVALAAPARAQQAVVLAGPPDQPVEIEADSITYAWEAQVLRLDGHVVARRGDGVVRAGSGSLDRLHGVLTLSGGVLGVQGKDVFLADSAVVDLNARSADLKGAVLYLKDRPANPAAPLSGKNSLIMHAQRVRQLPSGYQAEDVTLTPCDCPGKPDYEIEAHSAVLDGDRAHLEGAWLRMFGVPLPLFPLSLPLTQRQSGLLAPAISFGAVTGFGYAQPVFLTLGRSNDVTLSPGWYTGGSNHEHTAATPGRTVRGPQLGLEWRYAPVDGTAGSVALDLVDDLDQRDSKAVAPVGPAGEPGTSPGRGFGGVRGLLRVQHRTEGELGTVAVQGTVATDSMALTDFSPPTLIRIQDSLRTDLGAWQSRGAATVGLDATLLQDIRLYSGVTPDRRLFGAEANSAFQRLPALFAQVAPVAAGPFWFSAEASAAQFLSFAKPGPLERATGFTANSPGVGPDLEAGDVARAPALRLDVSPRLAWTSAAASALDLRLEAGGRADGWVMQGAGDRDRVRAYALAGAHAGLPLERAFDGGLLHRIEPSLDVRAISRPLQSGGPPIGDLADAGGAAFALSPEAAEQGLAPGLLRRDGTPVHGVPGMRRAYDEIDSAAPVTGAVEAVFSLSQSLWRKDRSRAVRLDLSQDALLWAAHTRARLTEATAHASAQLGPFGADALVRWDWSQHAISSIGASAGVHDARGDEAHAAAGVLAGSSSERLRGGIDELFSAARLAVAPGPLSGSAGAGGTLLLPANLRLAYNLARYVGPDLPAGIPNWTHNAALTYETSCHCAGLGLAVVLPFRDAHLLGTWTWRVTIDLKSLGSFGTF